MTENQPLRTFIIYARDDKEYKNQLLRHLKPLRKNGYLEVWHDGDILPGEDWEKKIKENLLASELVLVLVSVNCLNSEFIEGDELENAVERLHQGNTRIVPIIISPCLWRAHKIFNGLQGLPEDMKPVSNWTNPDSAWTNVAESLMAIVEETRAEQAENAKKQLEKAEKERLASIAAEQEAREKAERAEHERLTQERQEREAAEHKKRQAEEAAKKAEEDRTRREIEAEMQHRENEAWQTALAENTPGAFKNFASSHPNSPLVHEALRRAKANRQSDNGGSNRLIFIGLGTVTAIVLAVMFWPRGGEQKSVPAKPDQSTLSTPNNAEPAAWSQAQSANTLTAYLTYLNKHRDGANADIAKQRISEIKATVQDYLDDAERLIKNRKYGPAKPILRKILEELDPENARAKELMGQMSKE